MAIQGIDFIPSLYHYIISNSIPKLDRRNYSSLEG